MTASAVVGVLIIAGAKVFVFTKRRIYVRIFLSLVGDAYTEMQVR